MIEKQIKTYCKEIVCINEIQTYIISPNATENILKNSGLLSNLSIPCQKLQPFIEYTRLDSNIFFAFAYFPNRVMPYTWQPVNCYKKGNIYLHVMIRNTWFCQECKQLQYGLFIMPIIEHDKIFYSGTKNPYPPISTLFQKKSCIHCGKPFLNHFL